MLNKSIYSNPYLFIVLMDQHSSYFETYEDSSPHEGLYRIVKKFNSEKQTGDPLDVFGEYKIHGKEEFVRALTEMDPDYNKLKSTALPIPLDARKGAFEMALDLLSDLVVAK